MLTYDLHCHSTISDGTLPPDELLARAAERGVKTLALTDHDNLDGLPAAHRAAQHHNIHLINGVEISATWRGRTVHVVGLNVNPAHVPLREGVAIVRRERGARAEEMAASLARAGIGGTLEGAYRHASNPEMIGRTHFARFLIEIGRCKDMQNVFRNFLVEGKPGYVTHVWAALPDAVRWITGSGGVAVLAHPGRYRRGKKPLGKTLMRELLGDFVAAGGRGIEVVSSSHSVEQFAEFARYAAEFELYASCGSDFHGPNENYRNLGRLPDFPEGCRPVWQAWEGQRVAPAEAVSV
jgi:predicted metal-dependent phosphoesterase TrpH